MWHAFNTILSDRLIGIVTLTMLVLGFTFASTFPYLSIIFVEQMGQSERHYSILMFAMAVTGMVSGLVLGYLSDFVRDRRLMIIVTLVIGAIAAGIFFAWPNVWSFVICVLIMRPMSSNAFNLLFATIRAHILTLDSVEATAINSMVRTIYALSWILVPGLVGAYIAFSGNASDSFVFASAAFLASAVLYYYFGVASGRSESNTAAPSLGDAFKLLNSSYLFIRIFAISTINCAHALLAALQPLIMLSLAGGTTTDVGIVAGLTAGLEMPFMIFAGMMLRYWPTWKIIAAGGLVHVVYLSALWFVTDRWHLYSLAVLNAAAASVLLTLHISYMQDLIKDRPGLATSLMSVVSVISVGISAAVFALGSYYSSYTTTAFLGAAVVFGGCVLLVKLERF